VIWNENASKNHIGRPNGRRSSRNLVCHTLDRNSATEFKLLPSIESDRQSTEKFSRPFWVGVSTNHKLLFQIQFDLGDIVRGTRLTPEKCLLVGQNSSWYQTRCFVFGQSDNRRARLKFIQTASGTSWMIFLCEKGPDSGVTETNGQPTRIGLSQAKSSARKQDGIQARMVERVASRLTGSTHSVDSVTQARWRMSADDAPSLTSKRPASATQARRTSS